MVHMLCWVDDVGGCQNYGPFWVPLNIRCRNILRTPKRDHSSSLIRSLYDPYAIPL